MVPAIARETITPDVTQINYELNVLVPVLAGNADTLGVFK